ncbi:hypothetical protein RO3G_01584 [Rhizopus delemar RA 99-880]|uniref:Reverse transcriptase RNase H-like domain-containing protein n=1 Tax=Rhizopus delemar (strain RA 99-880 / ATCC MYA-4621 / FGSC 9543 / NRRL 43880) TaxID=246409 RepID=I1BL00_RHIO9|nr:hypothetical protein RO3G_01584 [Rhizopus delemar RA 99-880]|eukprot:EIE76880.1 hypothetical protein RO3G_01584 [Rhizopus delemar RA 99-880]
MNIFKEIEICKAVENDIIYKNIRLTSDLRGRLARWSLYLQQHDYTIIYRPAVKTQTFKNFCLLFHIWQNKELRAAPLPTGFSDESGVLFFGSRPVLPEALRNDMFELLHANPTTGHLGIGR